MRICSRLFSYIKLLHLHGILLSQVFEFCISFERLVFVKIDVKMFFVLKAVPYVYGMYFRSFSEILFQ